MPPAHRLFGATRLALAALLSLVAVGGPISATTPAAASPQDELAQKRAEADRLERQIATNGERISMLDEQFNQAQLAIDDATDSIVETQQRLDAAAQHTESLRGELAERAAVLYVGAANGSPVDMLDAADVSELGTRSKYGSAAADEDSALIDDLAVAQEDLEGARSEFAEQKAAAEARRADLEDTRTELEAAHDEQVQLLESAQGEIATLVAEVERQRRAAEEAQARAEAQRRQQAAAAERAAGAERAAAAARAAPAPAARRSGSPAPAKATPPPPSRGASVAPAPNGNAQTAVNTAMAQLGKPYRYAGSGPDSFDCSGLTQFAWAAAGVRLPHSSAAQYASLPHVSQDQLAPGDLVFYGSPIHHVGIYIGNGQYVHAPQTGDVVKVASAFRRDYVGAARPG